MKQLEIKTDKVVLISDLHLLESSSANFKLFTDLINRLEKDTSLIILGDFFAYYYGNDQEMPIIQKCFELIKNKISLGIKIYFMAGNRDFLLEHDLNKNTGAVILSDPCVLTHGDNKYVLTHGDQYMDEKLYLLLRIVLQSRILKKIARLLPIKWCRKIASTIRTRSENSNRKKGIQLLDQVKLQKILKKLSCNYMIHGHTHVPGITNNIITLSDWHDSAYICSVKIGMEPQLVKII